MIWESVGFVAAIDYKPCVEVTTRGTLSLLEFLRLKCVFSLMNLSFMKRGFRLFKVL